MMEIDEILKFPYDPWLLLGVPRETDDKTVKAAWRRAGSPDNGPLYAAFEMLKDEPSRLKTLLLSPGPYAKASDAADAMKKQPVFLGPGIWYNEIVRRQLS